MKCPHGKRGCHRMKTIEKIVVKRFENGDAEVQVRTNCTHCNQFRTFTEVQQSVQLFQRE